jgi:hypothetical protein
MQSGRREKIVGSTWDQDITLCGFTSFLLLNSGGYTKEYILFYFCTLCIKMKKPVRNVEADVFILFISTDF